MSKKKIDKDTVINRGQYSIVKIVMLNIIGGIFVLLGAKLVSICIEMVADIIKKGESFNATALLPMVIGLLFGLFGGIALFFAWKDVYHWRKKKIARECGEDGFAVIIDYYSISEGSKSGMNINRYYGFVLSYEKDGEQKTFKTDATFEINEYNYLKSLDQVKIKIYGDYVVINEEFRYGIYTKDSYSGLDKKYFNEKPYSTIIKIMTWFTIIWIVVFFVFFGLTIALKNNVFVFIGFAGFPVVIIPLGIVYAYYFFGGDKKKK